MPETVEVHVPRREIGKELTSALGEVRLNARLVEDGERCALEVWFADDEHDRLLAAVAHAIESWLSERNLPLVVQRANGRFVVLRPPAD